MGAGFFKGLWAPMRPLPVGRAAFVLVASLVAGFLVASLLSAAAFAVTGGWGLALVLNSLVCFGVPGVVARRCVMGVRSRVGVSVPGPSLVIILGILALVCQPVVQWAAYLDRVFYEAVWGGAESMASQSAAVMASVCRFDTVWHWAEAVVVLALLPAVCEEAFFRGALLPLVRRATGSWHVAVVVSALIFSLVHLDATAFLARAVLGCLLGVVFVQTRSLLASMLLHFCNNLLVVIALSESDDVVKTLTAPAELPSLKLSLLSLAFIFFEVYYLSAISKMRAAIRKDSR